MFEVLEQTIEELEIPPDGAALAKVITLEDRLRSKLSVAVGQFDHQGLWEMDGPRP